MASTEIRSKFISILVLTQLIILTAALHKDDHMYEYSDENADYATNRTDAVDKQYEVTDILKEVYAIITKNTRENTRKLILEDFSWGIFSGTQGRLEGFNDFQLVNNNTVPTAQKRKFNVSFEFTVPILRATWEKSVCLGHSCVLTMELKNAVFVLQMLFNARECVVDHLAYLKAYDSVKCYTNFRKTSTISYGFVATTVELLSQVMNTRPFQKIIKDNVNYALLQLPLFDVADIARICEAYQQI